MSSVSSRYSWFYGAVGFPLLAWLALPGRFAIWQLLFICLLPFFFWLTGASTTKQAFFRGLLAGIIFYILQLYWIVSVLTTFGGLPLVLSALSLVLLAFYMSLYLGIFSSCFYFLTTKTTSSFTLLAIPCLWVGLDWLRSWLFSGFPWMDFGYGLWSVPEALQVADLFGHHVLTFTVIASNLVFYVFISGRFRGSQKMGAVAALVLLIGVGLFYSQTRWAVIEESVGSAPVARIGIVQGNIEQGRKWSPEQQGATVDKYLRLSEELVVAKPPELIVWPETALPFYPLGNDLIDPVKAFVKKHTVSLLTGAPWYEVVNWEKRQFDYFNGSFMLLPSEEAGGYYFKSHLVPYGEYVPLKKYMPFLAPLVEAAGDFTPGEVGAPLAAETVRAGVLICYESIFPGIGRRWVENGANVIVNLTNDAWYGKSSAPYQSWAMTILRAVETRRSLVRSANTGISGVIDPLGRVRSESGLFVAWTDIVDVPLMTGRTVFVSGGFRFAPICAALGVLICTIALLTGKRRKSW